MAAMQDWKPSSHEWTMWRCVASTVAQMLRATLGHRDFGVEAFRNGTQIDDRLTVSILWFVERYPERSRCALAKDRFERDFTVHQIDELFKQLAFTCCRLKFGIEASEILFSIRSKSNKEH